MKPINDNENQDPSSVTSESPSPAPERGVMSERELRKTVTGFRSGRLGNRKPDLMCYAVCAPLHGYLSAVGFETSLIEGIVEHGDQETDHYWLELADGSIIDPIASQFVNPNTGKQMPEVYIGPIPAWYDSCPWRPLF